MFWSLNDDAYHNPHSSLTSIVRNGSITILYGVVHVVYRNFCTENGSKLPIIM